MARERGTVVFKFLADVKDLARGVKKAEGEIGGMAQRSSAAFNKAFSGATQKVTARLGSFGGEASSALNEIAGGAVEAGGALAAGVAAGAAGAAAALARMTASGVRQFADLASQVRQFQRVSGATAEDASRIVDVTELYGISADQAANATFRLSQNIAKHADVLKADGIQIAYNKNGTTDLAATLVNIAGAYKNTQDQVQRNKLVMDAFGRSGAALIPILDQGSAAIEKMFGETAKHHELLSQSDLDKAENYRIAVHDLDEAFGGLEMELGEAAIPAIARTARALTTVAEDVDKAGGAVSRFVGKLGAFPRALSYVAPFGNVLRGLFGHHQDAARAAEDHASAEAQYAAAAEAAKETTDSYNQSLADTLGAHIKAATTSSSLADALSKLADDSKDVDESVSGATEKVRTFQDAMHEEFDSLVDANEAALDYADSLDALNEALHGTSVGSEDAAAAMDRLTHGRKMPSDPRAIKRATDAAVKAAEQEVDAEVASGQVADTAAARKEALRKKLVEIQQQYPEVAGAVQQYIDKLDKIPNLTTKAEDSTKKLSKAKKDLAGDIVDVIKKAADEADQMKTTGTALDGAYQKHWKLLNVLNYLKAAYPALSGIIDTFLADVDKQWNDFLAHNPDALKALANSFGTGTLPGSTSPGGLGGAIGPALGAIAPIATTPAPSSGGGFYAPSSVTVNQTIQGDGLSSKEVADLSAKRVQRALVGSRAS